MSHNLQHYLQSSLAQQYQDLERNIGHLADPSATEALHDVRIAMRRLRSLLRPWREQGGWFAEVEHIAADLGRDTSPSRDRQVLIQELEKHGLLYQALSRREIMITACRMHGSDPRYALLMLAILALQERLADGSHDGQLSPAALADFADKLVAKLRKTLRKSHPDLHELRIKIKKLRYLYQAYPDHLQPSAKLLKALKRTQAELGEWHDNLQWLITSERELDLKGCRLYWQQEIDIRAARAQKRLKKLRKLLRSMA
tara:strand:+ start:18898 stop:19668 length:771 start_codon:yes stop_codon:yes gene_type:complete